ncbi:MAG TPA: ABC transporter substrate-binding protein [Gaiellaceae bacterium]|nr:ABC transporter substrate-binding protein [Gaiellaceae bacterium]
MKRVVLAVLALAAALSVSLPGAFARTEATAKPDAVPGITRNSIVIGGTFPLSGIASLYAPIPRGMEAYFNYVNARRDKKTGQRGIYGRKIVWKYYDDAYNPAQTVQLTNKLILEDRVFATVGSLGTEPVLAVRPLHKQRKVPQVLVSTGASYWGTQYKQFPWTQGWQTDYVAEGRVYARWILQNARNAKIAVFYQNDDYGKDYLRGLKQGLGSRRNLIVSEQSYELSDTSYASQIVRQRVSGADTWVLFSTPTPTVRALATAKAVAWKPDQIVINSVSATDQVMSAARANAGAEYVNGAISTGYLKNNTNPKYRRDGAVRAYKRIMARYGPDGININNTFYYYGVAKAYDFVRLMYLAGRNPTRASLMRATQRMNWVNPYALKGVRIKTSRTDRFPIDQGKVIRYQDGSWTEISGLYKGR